MCSFLNPPGTNKASPSSSSDSVPGKDGALPVHAGDNTVLTASSGSDAAHHNEEGRQEHGGDAGAALPSEEGDKTECNADETKEEYLVRAGGVIIKPYHWQGKYIGPYLLTVCTTGSRAAHLQLKEGLV